MDVNPFTLPLLFTRSLTGLKAGKEYGVEWRGKNTFIITKPGETCPVCTPRVGKTTKKSVRVQYSILTAPDGSKFAVFDWINVKCQCLTIVTYLDGHVDVSTYDAQYLDAKEFKELKKIPSNVTIRLRSNRRARPA